MVDTCCDTLQNLRQDLLRLTETVKKLKQEYQTLLIENLQKDLNIREIKKKIEENKFSSFESQLSKTCLVKLNLIGKSQKDDSTFVALALNELYNENTEAIKQKSLSGRSKKGAKKSTITPEKKKILERLFAERMSYVDADTSRGSNLNKLIRNAIDNANRK